MKDNVGTAERQAPGFGKDHVVADEHAYAAKIRRIEHRELVPADIAHLREWQIHLLIPADFFAVAAEKKRRVVRGAVRRHRVATNHEVHLFAAAARPR